MSLLCKLNSPSWFTLNSLSMLPPLPSEKTSLLYSCPLPSVFFTAARDICHSPILNFIVNYHGFCSKDRKSLHYSCPSQVFPLFFKVCFVHPGFSCFLNVFCYLHCLIKPLPLNITSALEDHFYLAYLFFKI